MLDSATRHVFLAAGSIVFLLPFLWMISTSAKVPREMADDSLAFLPMAPVPRAISPFVAHNQFVAAPIPADVPHGVWAEALPRIESAITQRLSDWMPEIPGGGGAPVATLEGDVLRAQMTEGLLNVIGRRLSDVARGADSDALVSDAERLLEEETLRDTFDAVYRRFCVGSVRARDLEFRSHALGAGEGWQVITGDATLVERTDGGTAAREVRYTMPSAGNRLVLRFVPTAEGIPHASALDRLFVSYRADASWARVEFHVLRDGRRHVAEPATSLFERSWIEQELRWPEGDNDPMARRMFGVLRDRGAAPADAPTLAIEMHVTRASTLGAWLDKMTRNYVNCFREVAFARYLMTSFSLAILNIVFAVFSCTLVGYAFARLEWPGRDIFFGVLLATMMLPPQVTMIPQFILFKEFGWFNTLLPLWIGAAFGIPFFIFLVRQFFKNIPTDLEDAARIDGCGFLRIYWHVMLPLVKPVVATIAIFTFMGSWNNFMTPLVYVTDERLFPLSLGLFKLNLNIGAGSSDIGLMMAGSFMMTLPIIVVFFFCQRSFVQGISLSGTKA
jgi:ABC-type glycerol-3-phosphate transport system permease component